MKNYEKISIAALLVLFTITSFSSVSAQEMKRPSWANQDMTSKNQLFVGPSIMMFDLPEDGITTFGITGEYIHKFSRKWGFILDAGYYSRDDGYGTHPDSDRLLHFSAGISYHPSTYFCNPKLSLSAHALLGITRYREIYSNGSSSFKSIDNAFSAIIGGGVNYRLGRLFNLRILQIDLIPTSFWQEAQLNARISAGLALNLPDRQN